MSKALHAFRLQQIDSQIDSSQHRLLAIQTSLENDQRVALAQAALSQAEKKNRASASMLQTAEAEVERIRAKISQTNANLYGGNVRNPKELQDLQQELAALKRQIATLEDNQLDAMLTNEEDAIAFAQSTENLAAAQSEFANLQATLTGEKQTLNKNIERCMAEKKAVTTALDADTLDLYEQLRKDKKGIAITKVNDGACGACWTNLTPAQIQAARTANKFEYCSSCGRILYAD